MPGAPLRHKPHSAINNKEAAFDKLASKLVENSTTGCFEFTGHIGWGGYGALSVEGKTYSAHRLMFQMAFGEIPPFHECPKGAYFVLHHCDNPKCCNPTHLYLGTAADNTNDMASRKRGRIGFRVFGSPERENIRTGRVYWEFKGEIKTLADWSKELGIHSCTLDQRFSAGWPPQHIAAPPRSIRHWNKGGHKYRRFSGDSEADEARKAATGEGSKAKAPAAVTRTNARQGVNSIIKG